ncbi:hypothetical protein BJ875DRAFT_482524 [Amylocarpus encephaloides]|uniref:Maintenance of telomere capping protein 6 n=1 Tax=Amylocarpus encephaloides TaxID=45428 RepID=A0A9P8C6Z7_9HELO|nr:hypothetical protein BJ875DRAFT_482524 [Amylocarpus encephaloides]
MNEMTYSPSPAAEPGDNDGIARLSQRDLGLSIPVNYVTQPGVSLSAACFPFNRYETENLADCLSNLLAMGYQKIEIDLYWDQGRQTWSFCPVELPTSIVNPTQPTTQPTSQASSVVSSSSSTSSAISSAGSSTTGPPSSSTTAGLSARQASSPDSLPIGSIGSSQTISPTGNAATSLIGASLSSVLPSVAAEVNNPDTPLVTIGPYTCTTTITLSSFTELLSSYFQATDDTLSARLLYVNINIHAAAPATSPLSSLAVPTGFPKSSSLLGNLFSANFTDLIYTPENLASERSNVNGSWYTVSEAYRPAEDYYNVTLNQYDIASTLDGWPSESYVGFSQGKRLLLGWGTISPQMTTYNFSSDDGTIFPTGSIQTPVPITASNTGSITSGCFLRPPTESLQIASLNSSWATSSSIPGFPSPQSPPSDLNPLLALTLNTTSCGISPILNTTLLNTTARQNPSPYHDFSLATIWSWAPSEPKDYPLPSNLRCALASSLTSRWSVSDCSSERHASCRALSQPYNWTLSTTLSPYGLASDACPPGYAFAVPRTALENAFLTQAMRARARAEAWVDLNALDMARCWVTGGLDASCRYRASIYDVEYARQRVIIVPTVAAIIVLIITALTVFVKAAGNRKSRRRTRKRAGENFVYEGVPL